MDDFNTFEAKSLESDLSPPTNSAHLYQRQNVPKDFEEKSVRAVKQGVVSLGYVRNIAQTRQVTITHNLGYAPICEVWWRDGTAAVQTNIVIESDVYALPIVTSDYIRTFYADTTNLYITNEQINIGGSGSFTDLFRFFIYADKFSMQPDTTATQSTV